MRPAQEPAVLQVRSLRHDQPLLPSCHLALALGAGNPCRDSLLSSGGVGLGFFV